jgi:hypothetical protein
MRLRAAIVVAALTGVSGCFGRGPRPEPVITDPDPAVKIPAIKASVSARDLSAVKQLVQDLESDDPAVRFYAIGGLQRLTGQTFDYHYYHDEEERQAAVEKWKAWLAGWEAGQREAAGDGAAKDPRQESDRSPPR